MASVKTFKAVGIASKLYAEKIEETSAEAEERRNTVCKKCEYWIPTSRMCNYLCVTGKIRPCHASLCTQKGIFSSKKRKRQINRSFNHRN